jgi:hypothetical protein
MKETGWQIIGRIAKARRERLGLKQDELSLYGGPGVATVGKFERAAQDSFPTRTQHQIENALGWSRTTIEQVVGSIDDGTLTAKDWEHDLINEDVPDLSKPMVAGGDDQLGQALDAIKVVLRLVEPGRIDEAVRRALVAVLPLLSHEEATSLGEGLRKAFPPEGGDGDAETAERGSAPIELRQKVSEPERRTNDLPAVAHEEGDIQREQEESEEQP